MIPTLFFFYSGLIEITWSHIFQEGSKIGKFYMSENKFS